MLNIWLLIIFGVIVVPLISGATKQLEVKLENMKKQPDGSIKLWIWQLKDEEEVKTLIKTLTYFLIALFSFIVIMMVRFTSQIISEN